MAGVCAQQTAGVDVERPVADCGSGQLHHSKVGGPRPFEKAGMDNEFYEPHSPELTAICCSRLQSLKNARL
jgi:hypothetical protein